jgi:GNAT superfamily N-acetyltransferase
MIRIIDINDSEGRVVEPAWLDKALRVHLQLRPHLPTEPTTAYPAKMQKVFDGGGRMSIAVVDGEVAGLGVYRIYENTVHGIKMYLDDLVTDETKRSTGVGHALMEHFQSIARKAGCGTYTLDSGTHRHQAHKFYFREGMVITSFNFNKIL